MIKLSAGSLHCKTANKILTSVITSMLILFMLFGAATVETDAAAGTVTLKYGEDITYGSGWTGHTSIKWVTHIDGEEVDLDDEPGVSRSYAYCVQPPVGSPSPGTYSVTLVDDDDTGRIAKMRKLIYYLPGSFGYTKRTKSRWFSDNTHTDAYVMGHLALSWIYESYSDSSDVWGGAPSSMVNKCKYMVDDLQNLPDPPDDYEVFWVRVSGKQDVFGAFYKKEYGQIKIIKDSANKTISNANSYYSIEGAEYTLYNNPECTEVSETRDGQKAVLRIRSNGETDTIEVETGTYYIKETKAPKGYALDSKAHSAEVLKDKVTSFEAHDIPKSNTVSILIQKMDKETGQPLPQGGASLGGAEYTVKYYGITPSANMSESEMAAAVSSKSPAKINGKSAVWVFKTDEKGRIDMSRPDKYLIKDKSAELYHNNEGKPVFPIGIISIEETAAPEGYLIDKTKRYASITDSGNSSELNTLKTFTGEKGLKEQVLRGDLSLKKAAEGRKRMSGIEFCFTSLTNGEKHILITDKNGYLSTASSWNPHDNNTNKGTSDKDGIWFNGYNDEKTGAKPNNSLGALPYDKYLMEEIRSEANKGYELISDEISIERNNVCLDLGTYDDAKEPVPALATQAKDAITKTNEALASDSLTIIDTVEYVNLKVGKTYTVEGVLMDKTTGEPLLDDEGNEVTGNTEFYAETDHGKVEVSFTLSAKTLHDNYAVVFEYLKCEGELVAEHTDINSKEQTVKIVKPEEPKLRTMARDDESDSHFANPSDKVVIVDEVMYENLEPGAEYVVEGILMNKKTGEVLLDDDGKIVEGRTEFTAESGDGTVEVTFNLSAKTLGGESTVVYEYLKQDDVLVASHTDIESKEQTIKIRKETKPESPKKTTKPGSPNTGEGGRSALLFYLMALGVSAEGLLLTKKRRNDRLN